MFAFKFQEWQQEGFDYCKIVNIAFMYIYYTHKKCKIWKMKYVKLERLKPVGC